MLKLQKSQYQNSIFQVNYTRYEKDVVIQNCLLQKDLQISIAIFFIRFIFFVLILKNTIKIQK